VVADAALREKLVRLTEPTVVVDENGQKLGRFIPEPAAAEPLIPWEPDVTREEIDRRVHESKGRTLADIWKRLGVQ
jgi:hypothetical protein